MKSLDILKTLVSFKTDSSIGTDYVACADYIASIMQKSGFDVEIVDGGKGEIKKPNILAQMLVPHAKDTILFAAHFDIVPPGEGWHSDPWTLTERDGKFFARGSSDNKASIAILAEALDGHKPNVNVKALFACDEEIGGVDGLGYVTEHHRDWLSGVTLSWIADSSTAFVGIGSSGVLGGKITAFGKGGHAGYPHQADNAVHLLIELLSAIKEYEKISQQRRSKADAPPESPFDKIWGRFNITMLDAGIKTNVIPEKAQAGFDLRFLPEEKREDIEMLFRLFFESTAQLLGINAEFSFIYGHEGYLQEITPAIERFREHVRQVWGDEISFAAELGGNDGPFTFNLGIPTISFGPIEADTCFHMPNEFVRPGTLEKMVQVTRKMLCGW